MNELTWELFESLAGAPPDEEGRRRIFGWLAALLKMPYLDDAEKENALALVDYLDGLDGTEPLLPVLRAARTRLRMKKPPGWEMEWPDNYLAGVNGESLTPEQLRRRGIAYVDAELFKPARQSAAWAGVRRLYADGRTEMLYRYCVFAAPPVAERHMFSVYGEKAAAEKTKKECDHHEGDTEGQNGS